MPKKRKEKLVNLKSAQIKEEIQESMPNKEKKYYSEKNLKNVHRIKNMAEKSAISNFLLSVHAGDDFTGVGFPCKCIFWYCIFGKDTIFEFFAPMYVLCLYLCEMF